MLQAGAGLGLLVLLIWLVGPRDLIAALSESDIGFIVLAMASHGVATALTGYRLKEVIGNGVSFASVYFPHMFGYFMGNITPAKSGYLASMTLLKRHGVSHEESIASALICQAGDFLVRIAVISCAIIYLSVVKLPPVVAVVGIITSAAFAGLLLLLVFSKRALGLLERLAFFGAARRFLGFMSRMQEEARVRRRQLLFIVMVGFLSWIFTSARWMFAAFSFGIQIPIAAYFLLHPLIYSSGFIPITVGGIGVVEGASTLILTSLGVPPVMALSCILVDRGVDMLFDLVGFKELMVR